MIETAQVKPVSVVLLAYNEAEVIEDVVLGFYRQVTSKIPGSEIIVGEDGSTDGTQEILKKLEAQIPQLVVKSGKERSGYLNAFRNALNLAKNDVILFCDASGKHDPNDFWHMATALNEADMVIGYKKIRKDPFYRLVLTRVFNFVVCSYFGVRFRDINSPLRIFKKSAFQTIANTPWYQKGLINFEFTLKLVGSGFKVVEVPITHFPRLNGPSRGLPIKQIPKVVYRTLMNFPKLKAEMTGSLSGHRPQLKQTELR